MMTVCVFCNWARWIGLKPDLRILDLLKGRFGS